MRMTGTEREGSYFFLRIACSLSAMLPLAVQESALLGIGGFGSPSGPCLQCLAV